MDYTNPNGIKMAVYNHVITLSNELKNFIKTAAPEIIAENAHIIAEFSSFIDQLNELNQNDIITVFYSDGLNVFEIIDK